LTNGKVSPTDFNKVYTLISISLLEPPHGLLPYPVQPMVAEVKLDIIVLLSFDQFLFNL